MIGEQDMFPSLQNPHPEPHGWIQWKGTQVCMDVYCACGKHFHMDESFCYHIKCPCCAQVYECDGHITLIPLDFEPPNTRVSEDWEPSL
jgi:hypothetical protein